MIEKIKNKELIQYIREGLYILFVIGFVILVTQILIPTESGFLFRGLSNSTSVYVWEFIL